MLTKLEEYGIIIVNQLKKQVICLEKQIYMKEEDLMARGKPHVTTIIL